jgi:hypothetical protein
MFSMMLIGQLARLRVDTGPLVGLGFIMMATALWSMSRMESQREHVVVIWPSVVMGIGGFAGVYGMIKAQAAMLAFSDIYRTLAIAMVFLIPSFLLLTPQRRQFRRHALIAPLSTSCRNT